MHNSIQSMHTHIDTKWKDLYTLFICSFIYSFIPFVRRFARPIQSNEQNILFFLVDLFIHAHWTNHFSEINKNLVIVLLCYRCTQSAHIVKKTECTHWAGSSRAKSKTEWNINWYKSWWLLLFSVFFFSTLHVLFYISIYFFYSSLG